MLWFSDDFLLLDCALTLTLDVLASGQNDIVDALLRGTLGGILVH